MVLTPEYKILINGKEIKNEMYPNILDVNVTFTHNGSSICSLTISDADMVYIQDDLIVKDSPIKIILGTKEEGTVEFSGYISVLNIDFPEDGVPTIEIHGMDGTHIMNRKKKKRTWENKKISDVVSEILQSYGFKATVDDTKTKLETIEQSDITDNEFITNLCDELPEPFIYYVEGANAYFIKRKYNQQAKETLVYRQSPYNLLSFSPSINKEDKKIEPLVADLDLKTLDVVHSSMKPNDELLGSVQVTNRDKRV